MPPKIAPSGSRHVRTTRMRSQQNQLSAAQAAPTPAPADDGEVGHSSQCDDIDIDIQEVGNNDIGNKSKTPRRAPSIFSTKQIAGMSKAQLRVIVLGLQVHPNTSSGSNNLSIKRKREVPSNVTDRDMRETDEEGEDAECENSSEDEDEFYDDDYDKIESEERETYKKIEKIVSKHIRRSIWTAAGWKYVQDAKETRYGSDGEPIFLFKNKYRVEVISPVWESTFDENWRHWGSAFIRQCRNKDGMGVDATILNKISDERFRENLRTGVWRLMCRYAREKARGGFDEYQVARVAQTRDLGRQKNVLGRRSQNRIGTCVADKRFNWLFNVKCQSRASSDSEDTRRRVILEPSWRNPMITKVYDALDRKAKLNGRNSQKKLVHFRVDTLPLALGKNELYPFWALDPKWIETHPADFTRVEYMFNTADRIMPDVKQLLQQYKCPGRTYITQLPTPRRPRPVIPAVPVRPASPSGTIDLRSVSPPTIVREPPASIQNPRPRPVPRVHLVVQPPPVSQPPFRANPHPDPFPAGSSNVGSSSLTSDRRVGDYSLEPIAPASSSMRVKKRARTVRSVNLNTAMPKAKAERDQPSGSEKNKGKSKQVVHDLDDEDSWLSV